jgi:hypothetical protein
MNRLEMNRLEMNRLEMNRLEMNRLEMNRLESNRLDNYVVLYFPCFSLTLNIPVRPRSLLSSTVHRRTESVQSNYTYIGIFEQR